MTDRRTAPWESDLPRRTGWRPPASIMAGSALTVLPVVASVPLLPPAGLLMLLGWRLTRADLLPRWAPPLLGLFDDLLSGQPPGSAMLLWALCVLGIDVLDTRLVWRDFWQNWLIAAAAIGFCLIAGRLLATDFTAHVDSWLLIQIVVSIACFPLAARLCAALDTPARER
ncbi:MULTISPECIES: rod shape-determining protein MreD [unclassified Sphingomonas]|uniref:rod shape-determining protein MreD n=1 Tax=unclassified Sphingomonas TaxID=196159 RepID=UPI00082B65B5|nr:MULTISPECIES: rod shape-determining protein MreD [unclassified Sphingomonas]MCH4892454.1 rod shape-determining protein MreD [Sphingomonas sp. SFZ2018-12]